MKNKQTGFTLFEVMVVVAIIGILSSIAWPLYQEQNLKSKRNEGATALLLAFAEMEKCYSDYADYTHANCDFDGTSENGYYTITEDAGTTSDSYTLTATTSATFTDPDCATLKITHLGVKMKTTTSGSYVPLQRCWRN